LEERGEVAADPVVAEVADEIGHHLRPQPDAEAHKNAGHAEHPQRVGIGLEREQYTECCNDVAQEDALHWAQVAEAADHKGGEESANWHAGREHGVH